MNDSSASNNDASTNTDVLLTNKKIKQKFSFTIGFISETEVQIYLSSPLKPIKIDAIII